MKPSLVTLLLFVSLLRLGGQTLPFRNYQAKDGLPSSEVYYVIQDHEGYMWFGTDAGVSRYDGYSFHNYTTNDGLCDNTVFQLYEDHHNRIWCRTIKGCISYFENGRFVAIGANERIRAELGSILLTQLCVDDEDVLWLGAQSGKLMRIAPPYDKVEITHPPYTDLHIFDDGYVYSLLSPALLKNGKLVAPVHITGQHLASPSTDTLPSCFIIRYVPSAHDQPALLSFGEQLYEFDGKNFREIYDSPGLILAIYRDGSNSIWVGEADHGITVLQKTGSTYHVVRNYLGTDRISSIAPDFEGGLWFTSVKNGVYYLPHQGIVQFKGLNSDDNRMMSITSGSEGVFAANYNGEVMLLRPDSLDYSTQPVKLLTSDLNKRLFMQGDDSLLIGNTALELHTKEGMPRLLLNELQTGTLVDMTPGKEKNNWWVANPVRVFLVDIASGKKREALTVPGTRVNSLFFMNDTLWLGCLDGLWSWSRGVFHYHGTSHPELRNRIDDILSPDGTRLVLATRSSGIILFDRRQCRTIGSAQGLSSDLCRSLLLANDSTVWIGASNGINLLRLGRHPHVLHVITANDGLTGGDIAQLCSRNGKLFAATTRGVVAIDTTTCFGVAPVKPVIHLTGASFREKKTALADAYDVPYDQNNVQFDFIGISYLSGGKLRYRYQLEGLDTAWTISTSTFARYGSLAPGDYTFTVYALNTRGIMSQRPRSIRLHIRSPFWMTWWFISLAVITLILATWLFVRSRIRRVQKLARIDAEFKQRIAETELKALRAQMNPHFIFNAIGSIQNFILTNENEAANKYLLLFARLIRNVLEYSKAEVITLRQEAEMLQLYLEIESLRFKGRFSWNIALPDVNLDETLVPPLLLQPFVENALWHGLMPQDKRGELRIRIDLKDEQLVCVVEDNGIGRKASENNKTQAEKKRSLATSISLERIEAVEQLSGKRAKLEITDLHTAEGVPCGTRVTILLPLMKLS